MMNMDNNVFLPRWDVKKEATVTLYSEIMCNIIIESDSEVVLYILSTKDNIIVFAEEAEAKARALEVTTQEVRTREQTHSELTNQRRSRISGRRTTTISGITPKKPQEADSRLESLEDRLQKVHTRNEQHGRLSTNSYSEFTLRARTQQVQTRDHSKTVETNVSDQIVTVDLIE
jgi:hypothetical protein